MSEPLLIVDDDAGIRDLLAEYLQGHGYAVDAVADGPAMWQALEHRRYALIVLDIMLPGEDGLSLCRNLRAQSDIAIIMLTALGEDTERIIGLEMGADDYLAKPFNPRELLARIRVVLRRSQGEVGPSQIIRFAQWTLDREARHLLSPEGVVINLSSGEYRLLEVFVQHPSRVLSRDQLMDLLQGRDWAPFDRSIDVQVSRLRKRLKTSDSDTDIIKTIRGQGYLFSAKITRVQG